MSIRGLSSSRPMLFAGVAFLIVGAGSAQQTAPWKRPGDLLVTDTTADIVYRLADLNLDGDYDDAGEITVFYSSGTGGFTMPLMVGLGVGPDGSAFVCDTTADLVLRLRDLNGDGDAQDAGEATVWFGSSGSAFPNASGIPAINAPSMLGLAVSPLGHVLVVNAGAGSAPLDAVFRFADLNGDGDAQDAGEATVYATLSTSTSGNNSVPSSVAVAPDGIVYYGESGGATGVGRGVWRLADMNNDGDCDDGGEKTLYYQPAYAVALPTPPTAVAFYGLAFDDQGRLFVSDHTVDKIFALTDLNGDFAISPGSAEEVVYFTAPAPSIMWNVVVGKDLYGGLRVLATEDQSPERIHALTDNNNDGDASDGGEATTAYSDAVASVNFDGPRAAAFMKGPGLTASPLPAVLGQTFTVTTSAGAGDIFVVELGVPLRSPVPIAPLGALYLDLTPGTYFDLLPLFILPASGEFSVTFTIPNYPPLLALTFLMQGVGGPPARILLTNAVTLTFI